MEKLNFTEREARKATKEEAMNEETQKLFKEYAEGRMVLVNRQPSLHEYSLFCVKIRLWDEYAIGFPPAIKNTGCCKILLNAGTDILKSRSAT